MSRNMWFVAIVLGLLVAPLAPLAGPAVAAPPEAGDAAVAQAQAGAPLDVELSTAQQGVGPDGGCETGGAGGCPVHG